MSADSNSLGNAAAQGAATGSITASNATPVVGPKRIDEYLKEVLAKGGSDLHFIAGDPPRIRLYGELQPLRNEVLEPRLVEEILREIMPRNATVRLEEKNGADFAHIIPGVSRFRVNILRHLNGMGAVFRAIPSKAKTLDDLKLPDAVRNMCKLNSGLILVTGKTGSGKSTTLAAMIDDINSRMKGHIITIEDPIEFVHTRKSCLISQREVGLHTGSFADALHSALREDPDVVLVGEMRDYETISIAVTAADKQAQVRAMLSTSLRGVISQQLLPTKGKPGRVAALEIMVNTPAVANLIRQGKLDQLENTIQSGAQFGMRTMDTAIQELLDKAFVSGRNAYLKAINKSKFEAVKDQN